MPAQYPAAVQRVLDQVFMEVDDLSRSAARELVPVLRGAIDDVGGKLAGWLGDQNGADRYTPAKHRQVLLQLRGALERAEQRAGRGALSALKSSGEAAGVHAARHTAAEIEVMNRAFGDFASTGTIPIREAATLARGKELLVPRHERSAARYGADVTRDIQLQLARGLVGGETIHQLTERLANLGGPRGMVNIGPGVEEYIPEGLFRRYRFWGERLTRTEVMNAYNVQHEVALRLANKDDPGFQQQWDASLDFRACPICRGLHGKVAELGKDFPGGFRRPPAHPYCRCVVLPYRTEWAERMPTPAPVRPPKPTRQRPVRPVKAAPAPAPPQNPTVATSRQLLEALEESTAPGGRPGSPRDVRGYLRDLVGRRGATDPNRDQGISDYVVGRTSPGAAGTHYWGGTVGVAEYVHKDAISFLKQWTAAPLSDRDIASANAMRTLVHEEFHGFGPGGLPISYQAHGVVVEEVTTELSARRVMLEEFGQERFGVTFFGQYRTGSYDAYIRHVLDAYQLARGGTQEEAFEAVTRASLETKTMPASRQAHSPDELLAHLSDALGLTGRIERVTFEEAVRRPVAP